MPDDQTDPTAPNRSEDRASREVRASRSGNPARKAEAEKAKAATQKRRTAQEVTPPNPTWWVPVMCALLIIGLLYLVVTYIMSGQYPLPIGNWNLVVGFAIAMIGGAMALRWR